MKKINARRHSVSGGADLPRARFMNSVFTRSPIPQYSARRGCTSQRSFGTCRNTQFRRRDCAALRAAAFLQSLRLGGKRPHHRASDDRRSVFALTARHVHTEACLAVPADEGKTYSRSALSMSAAYFCAIRFVLAAARPA